MEHRFVRQEDEYGCGLAAIAMLLRSTYSEVKKVAGDKFNISNGMTDGEVCAVINSLLERHGSATDALFNFNLRLTCILRVPSLNQEGKGHYIFYSPGTSFLDPNKGVEGKKYYTNENLPLISKIICLNSPEVRSALINQLAYTANALQRLGG